MIHIYKHFAMRHDETTFQFQPEIENHGRILHLHILMEEHIHALTCYFSEEPCLTHIEELLKVPNRDLDKL